MDKKFVVGIAAKNEEENVEYIINDLRKNGLNDIYIVDEHSKDRTEEIAKRMNIPVYQRKGIDCDGTYPAEDLKEMTKYIKDYDLIMGYRNYNNVTFSHRLPNRFFTLLTNILF